MIPAFEDGASSLVVGRYLTTVEEVRERFVTDDRFTGSTTRASIWDEWEQATAVLREAVPVAQVWLAGSFTTTKLDPQRHRLSVLAGYRSSFRRDVRRCG